MKTQKFDSHKNFLLTLGIMVAMIISITTWFETSSDFNHPSSSITKADVGHLMDSF